MHGASLIYFRCTYFKHQNGFCIPYLTVYNFELSFNFWKLKLQKVKSVFITV